MKRNDNIPTEWLISENPVPYLQAIKFMKQRAKDISMGDAKELVWLLEHSPLYSAGTSAKDKDLIDPDKFPVFTSGRGGQYTYHGPGQRIIYIMLDLTKRGKDIRAYIKALEGLIINTLSQFNIKGKIHEGKVGVWVDRPEKGNNCQDKIAAIGVRVSRWVSFHGISLNISPNLSHYDGIIPCGISDNGVTSFEDLGHITPIEQVDVILRQVFEEKFGTTINCNLKEIS